MARPGVSGGSLASGLLLVGIAAFMGWSARGLTFTSGGQMGPGYFPMLLCGALAALGVAVIFTGGRSAPPPDLEHGPVPWRGVALVTAALLWFALSVRPLGLAPALAGAVFVASVASRRWRPLPSLAITALMVGASWLVFIRLLGMPVAFLGPALR